MSDKIIYGVQLHPCGPICYFTPESWFELQKGDHVVVRLDRGESMAEIVSIINPQNTDELGQKNSAHEFTQANTPTIYSTGSPTPHQIEAESLNSEFPKKQDEPKKKSALSKKTFKEESFQWEVWNGENQEEDIGEVEASLCHDPQSPNIQPIIRPATDADLEKAQKNEELAKKAHCFCTNRARYHNLVMKMVQAEYLLDGSKILFYFTSPNRIDFRELVKDLVKEFRTRIELRQIGVRHETQKVGATGNCGMVCCCRRYMRRFAPVTIKMAKEQNLFLNPVKISGTCGRLLCCLAFEQESYEEFHSRCPKIGKKYVTNRGAYKVLRSSIFRNTVLLLPEEGDEYELTLDEWQALNPTRQNQNQPKGYATQNIGRQIADSGQQNEAKGIGQRHQQNENSNPKNYKKTQSERPEPQDKPEYQERPNPQERGHRPNHSRKGEKESRPKSNKNEKGEDNRNQAVDTKVVPNQTELLNIQHQAQAPNPKQMGTSVHNQETNNALAKQGEIKTVGLSRFLSTTGDDESL